MSRNTADYIDLMLLTEIRRRLVELGEPVHWTLPPTGSTYPFIVMGEVIAANDDSMKHEARSEKEITIHIWDRVNSRAPVTMLLADAKAILRRIRELEGGFVVDRVRVGNSQILVDNNTNETLYHGVLQMNYYYNEE